MRITITLPDEMLEKASQQAAKSGITLDALIVAALRTRLTPPPTVDGPAGMRRLSREDIDEAMLG